MHKNILQQHLLFKEGNCFALMFNVVNMLLTNGTGNSGTKVDSTLSS